MAQVSRGPDQISNPVFARVYDWLSRRMENRGVARHRARLLQGVSGRIIEVGAGNGLNFAHYPPATDEVVAVEPEPRLRAAAERAAGTVDVPITVVDATAAALPVGDGTFDAAVASLMLCSVADQEAALTELHRVLRPGGQLRFFEHVAADGGPLARLQRGLDATVWPRLAGGCHCHRDTVAAIAAAGFEIEELDAFRFPESPLPVPTAPHVLGRARRP